MFFVSSKEKPAVGELFKVDLLLNTNEENINTVAGKINFPADLLELQEIRDGNSLVNLWVDKPMLAGAGQIPFSGITPGGYKGTSGLLFSLIFHVLKSGSASLKLTEGQALLNDGKGTEAQLSTPALSLQLAAKSTGQPVDYTITDKTPPESFVPEIAQDKNIADNKWFVVFVAQDKDSGIDHYEIQENKNSSPNSTWQTATSPYILQDQSLQSYVYIKAVDKAGNVTVEQINPKNVFPYKNLLVYGIILLAIIILGIVSLRSRKFRRR